MVPPAEAWIAATKRWPGGRSNTMGMLAGMIASVVTAVGAVLPERQNAAVVETIQTRAPMPEAGMSEDRSTEAEPAATVMLPKPLERRAPIAGRDMGAPLYRCVAFDFQYDNAVRSGREVHGAAAFVLESNFYGVRCRYVRDQNLALEGYARRDKYEVTQRCAGNTRDAERGARAVCVGCEVVGDFRDDDIEQTLELPRAARDEKGTCGHWETPG